LVDPIAGKLKSGEWQEVLAHLVFPEAFTAVLE